MFFLKKQRNIVLFRFFLYLYDVQLNYAKIMLLETSSRITFILQFVARNKVAGILNLEISGFLAMKKKLGSYGKKDAILLLAEKRPFKLNLRKETGV